ncbi:hypothetical protein AHAS_Ahas15G0280000 [Arachis hypogaea]
MVDMVVGMVDMGWGHMEVNGGMRLIDMHQDLNCTHKKPEEVVAKKVVHKLGDPPTFDLQIFDTYPHCSFYCQLLQHSCNHTHSQQDENS